MTHTLPVKRALITVTDKTGLEELAKALTTYGCEILASGGTATYLRSHGIEVRDVTELTKNGEHFGGRMKTLSFPVAAGILFDREKDREEFEELHLDAIDMVVCNLYDFDGAAAKTRETSKLIESIDIGGPTLIRAAAKNFLWTASVTSPKQYAGIMDELKTYKGALTQEMRCKLMKEAFVCTADYDTLIANVMAHEYANHDAFKPLCTLSYGENPHQKARILTPVHEKEAFPFQLLQGKDLSWNNILDLESGLSTAWSFNDPTCVIMKHTLPCGLAQAKNLNKILQLAWEGDPVSAFGGVITFNFPVEDVEVLSYLGLERKDRKFVEAIAAPSFSESVLKYMAANQNLRAVKVSPGVFQRASKERRFLYNTFLMEQDCDKDLLKTWEHVTDAAIPDHLKSLALFGITVARQLKSNAIAIVQKTIDGSGMRLVGAGSGQPNRVQAAQLAIEAAKKTLQHDGISEAQFTSMMSECIAVSDAFFPFADSIEMLAAAGIRHVVQPGGSIRDKDVIAAANKARVAMAMTGMRHFRH